MKGNSSGLSSLYTAKVPQAALVTTPPKRKQLACQYARQSSQHGMDQTKKNTTKRPQQIPQHAYNDEPQDLVVATKPSRSKQRPISIDKTNVSTGDPDLSARRSNMSHLRESKQNINGRRNTASSSFSRKSKQRAKAQNMASAYNVHDDAKKEGRKKSVQPTPSVAYQPETPHQTISQSSPREHQSQARKKLNSQGGIRSTKMSSVSNGIYIPYQVDIPKTSKIGKGRNSITPSEANHTFASPDGNVKLTCALAHKSRSSVGRTDDHQKVMKLAHTLTSEYKRQTGTSKQHQGKSPRFISLDSS